MIEPLTVELFLRHEVRGGHDVFWLGIGDGECAIVVDYARSRYRRASVISASLAQAGEFLRGLGKVFGEDISFEGLQLHTSPQDLKFVFISDHEDAEGIAWQIAKIGFGSDPSIYLHLCVDEGVARLEEKSPDARGVFLTNWRKTLFPELKGPRATEITESSRPTWWVSDVPLVENFESTGLRFKGLPQWCGDALVGVVDDALVVLENRRRGPQRTLEGLEIDGFLVVGVGALVAHQTEVSWALTWVPDLESGTAIELLQSDSEIAHITPSLDECWASVVVQKTTGPITYVLGLKDPVGLVATLEGLWATSWSPERLELRDIDRQEWFGWNETSGLHPLNYIPPRRLGPHEITIDGTFCVGDCCFEPPDAASRRRMVAQVYQPLDPPWIVAEWSDVLALNTASNQGFTLVPESIARRGSVRVNDKLTRVSFSPVGGVTFVAPVSQRFRGESHFVLTDRAEVAAQLQNSLGGDIFAFRGCVSHLSLAALSEKSQESPDSLRVRLTDAGEEFVKNQLHLARQALSTGDVEMIAALGVDNAAAWSILHERLGEHALLEGLGHAAAQTYVDRLVLEDYVHQIIFGGVRPTADAWDEVVETLQMAEERWLSAPEGGLEERLFQALAIVYELTSELRQVTLVQAHWDELQLRKNRLIHLMETDAISPYGLEEVLGVIRCVEEMTGSL